MAEGIRTRSDAELATSNGCRLSSIDGSRPKVCENAKSPGFRVSLHPSRVVTKPTQRDLKVEFFDRPA
jgi:hypothetical protein